jgi:hypothetical protein
MKEEKSRKERPLKTRDTKRSPEKIKVKNDAAGERLSGHVSDCCSFFVFDFSVQNTYLFWCEGKERYLKGLRTPTQSGAKVRKASYKCHYET